MKITIELDDKELQKLAWTKIPQEIGITTQSNSITYDGCDINNPQRPSTSNRSYDDETLVIRPGSYYWEKQSNPNYDPFDAKDDECWIEDKNICSICPNRPGGPLNTCGFCNCVIPSMYGPYRITC